METLFFWVKIMNIPLTLEVKEMIINVASLTGHFLELDQKLFDTSAKIQVQVAHEITKPFILKKTLKLAPGVVEEIVFFFENLIGRCRKCNLIFHANGSCLVATPPKTDPSTAAAPRLDLVSPFIGFKEPFFTHGMFKFQGSQLHIPPVARNLFSNMDTPRGRRPLVIKHAQLRQSMTQEDKDANQILAMVPGDSEPTVKRSRPASPFTSLKKLKFVFEELQSNREREAATKKIKVPKFSSKIMAKSLGLIETRGGMLVPKEVMTPIATISSEAAKMENSSHKKKRGRPLGSKNKKPSNKKDPAQEVLSLLYSKKSPSPSSKGKEKV
ncbi:uncharacterized protein LOC112198832 [Rosa chinensis]|uniref:uncharacterized protein LOC112198832 n=1 Tax=Rosa chinensis TaxID=74649 RepID=UPI000D08A3EF|nr:uncharacterized protein LOC112198832 [Rosa chinensis]